MKLIGSRRENSIEYALIRSKWLLFKSLSRIQWKDELLKLDPNLKTAYMLDCINEQGEDIRTYITDKKAIYVIEISSVDPEEPVIVEQINFYAYKKSLRGERSNLYLMIALKLIAEDLKDLATTEKVLKRVKLSSFLF